VPGSRYAAFWLCRGRSLDGLTSKLRELEGAVATAGGNHAVSPRRYNLRDSPLKAETRIRGHHTVSSQHLLTRHHGTARHNQRPKLDVGSIPAVTGILAVMPR